MAVHKAGNGNFRSQDFQFPEAAAPPPMATVSPRIFDDPVAVIQPWVAGLKDLYRGIAAIAVDRTLGMVPIAGRLGTPATAIEVVVGIDLAGVWMQAAKEKIGCAGATSRGHLFGYGLGQAAKEDIDNALVDFGIAADAGTGVFNVDNAARRHDHLDRTVTPRVARDSLVGNIEHGIEGSRGRHPISAVAGSPRLRTGPGVVENDFVVAHDDSTLDAIALVGRHAVVFDPIFKAVLALGQLA